MLNLEKNCTVIDKNMRSYKVVEIEGDKIVIWSLDKMKRYIGPISSIGTELFIVRDSNGFDSEGFDINGYDKDGYDYNGYGKDGFNREGIDKNGFDENGYNRSGFDKAGFDVNGYDKNGKHRSEIKLPNYEGSCYAGRRKSWPGVKRQKRRK